MNKAELIEGLTARLGDKKVATTALEGFIDIIERAVAKGEKVSITGFGTFEKVDRPARKARNPLTGETIRVKKTSVPKFRPGTALKQVANGTTKKGREPKHEPLLPQGVTRLVSQPAATTATTARTTTAKPAAKAAASKPTAAKKSAPAKKVAAKTTGSARTAATKTATKTAAAAKTAAKKTATKTTTAAKTAAPAKATTTKAAATKTAAKKAPATKTAAKKAPARKAPARKAAAAK